MGESCDLTGSFSIVVQSLLGVLSFLILIVKRFYEKPKRQWKIWALDTSKQLVSALIAHLLNLLLSIILSSGEDNVDPCNWYFVTVMFDTTAGVFVCYILLMQLEKLLTDTKFEKYKSGNYFSVISPDEAVSRRRTTSSSSSNSCGGSSGEEVLSITLLRPVVQVEFKIWLMQMLIWNSIVIISKSLLYLLQTSAKSVLLAIATWLFQSITNMNMKLVVVIAIIPVCMNGIQFWVQDNFLKKHDFSAKDREFLMVEMFEQDDLDGFICDGIGAAGHNKLRSPQRSRGMSQDLFIDSDDAI